MLPLAMPRQHLLTVAEYMTTDIDARTELIGGVVYDVSPRNEPHRYAVRKLTDALARGLANDLIAQAQDAVAVGGWRGYDAPEIDVAVIGDRYYDPMPTAADAVAFVEVADTTYAYDRRTKIPLYVTAGVTSYIVNIVKRQIEEYASDDDLALPNGRVYAEDTTIVIAGVTIAVRDLFMPV